MSEVRCKVHRVRVLHKMNVASPAELVRAAEPLSRAATGVSSPQTTVYGPSPS